MAVKVYAGGMGLIEIHALHDGKTHVNIYSAGKTELGRRLTNFSKNDFIHPEYGWFQSMEAYWYWCATGKKVESFRSKWGVEAKRAGQSATKVYYEGFHDDMLVGIHCKLSQWPDIYQLLSECELPLTHYYCHGTSVKCTESFNFILDELELIKNGKPLMFPLTTRT